MKQFKLLIGGQLVPGDSEMDVINPATGASFQKAPRASKAQALEAIAAARAAFPSWASTPAVGRLQKLVALADAVKTHAAGLARLVTLEQGKPLSAALGEVGAIEAFIRYFASLAIETTVLDDAPSRKVMVEHRPLGVVAIIAPWNFPLGTIAAKLAPALAAGNCVVIKPAPTTPLSALALGELCCELFPPGVVNIITDANDLGQLLASHPDIRKVAFTGSTATGKKVAAEGAATLKRVTLELGGNDAAIVLDDADPKTVAPALFNAAFGNSGQVCLAIKRLYVHDAIYDAVCEELKGLADAAIVDDGMKQGTQFGPVQNRMQFEKIKELIEDGRKHGSVLTGGAVDGASGYFVRPTLVRDIADGCRLVDEEQFGPVLPILKFLEVDDAVRRANDTSFGLGASVWSSNTERALHVAHRLDAGTVWINQHAALDPTIPFGGAKESGFGVELGYEGLLEYTQAHVINIAR